MNWLNLRYLRVTTWLRDNALRAAHYISDEPHRRAVAAVIAGTIAHFAAQAWITDDLVANMLQVASDAMLAAWSRRTPSLPPVASS